MLAWGIDAPVARPDSAGRPAPRRSGLSWAEADSLGRKLAAIEEHRHLVAPLLLELRVAVDVDHLDVETVAALELLQGRDHVVAKVAVAACEHRQSRDARRQPISGRNVT